MALRIETPNRNAVQLLNAEEWAENCGFLTSPAARDAAGREAVLRQRLADVSPDGMTTLTVATFNTLRKNYYFGDKDWVPEAAQDWVHRRALIHDIIMRLDADVLGLQEAELDSFDEDFAPALAAGGYEFVQAEARSASERSQHGHTKPTLAYRASLFRLVDVMPRSRAVVAVLEHRASKRSFFAAACHLQGGAGSGAWMRCCQVMKLLRSVEPAIASYCRQTGCSVDAVPFVLLGDFNALHTEPVCTLLRGPIDADAAPADWAAYELQLGKLASFRFPLAFEDCLSRACAGGAFTKRPYTFKWGTLSRAEREDAFQSIDNVFTAGPLRVQAVRELTERDHAAALESGHAGLPSLIHPSDHLPLAMRLEWHCAAVSTPLSAKVAPPMPVAGDVADADVDA